MEGIPSFLNGGSERLTFSASWKRAASLQTKLVYRNFVQICYWEVNSLEASINRKMEGKGLSLSPPTFPKKACENSTCFCFMDQA